MQSWKTMLLPVNHKKWQSSSSKNVNLGTIPNELYRKYIIEESRYTQTDYNLQSLSEHLLQEVQIYNSMYPSSIYEMDGKEKSSRPPSSNTAPSPSTSTPSPAPAPPVNPVPSPSVTAPGRRERPPLDFAAIDNIKTEIRSAPDVTAKIISLFQTNTSSCPLHRTLTRPHALI
mmetsp:Transcript_433/g.683  ORF Transcript_433/g.683 Transcript_433/m.683 type:complete len:173 (-) Transcript_433:459-977(-)